MKWKQIRSNTCLFIFLCFAVSLWQMDIVLFNVLVVFVSVFIVHVRWSRWSVCLFSYLSFPSSLSLSLSFFLRRGFPPPSYHCYCYYHHHHHWRHFCFLFLLIHFVYFNLMIWLIHFVSELNWKQIKDNTWRFIFICFFSLYSCVIFVSVAAIVSVVAVVSVSVSLFISVSISVSLYLLRTYNCAAMLAAR